MERPWMRKILGTFVDLEEGALRMEQCLGEGRKSTTREHYLGRREKCCRGTAACFKKWGVLWMKHWLRKASEEYQEWSIVCGEESEEAAGGHERRGTKDEALTVVQNREAPEAERCQWGIWGHCRWSLCQWAPEHYGTRGVCGNAWTTVDGSLLVMKSGSVTRSLWGRTEGL